MTEQKHIVKRQIIELEVQGAAEARGLQVEVSQIYRRRVVPLLERYCTELSRPDQIHRIERLELDLGYLDPRRLEEELMARLAPALRQALAEQINAQEQAADGQGQRSQTRSHLELLAFFARTGSLPWWADASQPQLLAAGLRYLLEHAPGPLRQLLRELVREPHALQRLIAHYEDGLLARLTALLSPVFEESTLSHDLQALLALLQETRAAVGRRPDQLRQSLWRNLLELAGQPVQPHITPGPFYQALLVRVAAGLGVSYSALIAGVYQSLPAGREHVRPALKATLENLYRESRRIELPQAATPPPTPAQTAVGLEALIARLPASLRETWRSTLDALERDVSTTGPLPPATLRQRLLSLVQAGEALAGPDLPAELDRLAGAELSPAELSELIRLLRAALSRAVTGVEAAPTPAGETELDLSFSDADELYIGNAGLVILWPFLERFFERLELLEGRQFKAEAARQRAIGLLQHIATGEAVFPEYLLPLNKVLCGLDLTGVFDFGPPLLEAETEECLDLLWAVIAQAPILRDMSVPGFRGTFLLRQGVLRARDGAWLLQVERETYDIVLDRFPWGWEWLKLPWMEAPLRVEW